MELVDESDVAFGSFELDPGESVDVEFVAGLDGDEVHLTVLIGTVTVTVYGQVRTLTAGDGDGVFWPLVFVGPLQPYAAPPASFKIRSTIPFGWQYSAGGVVVDSAGANPSIARVSGILVK